MKLDDVAAGALTPQAASAALIAGTVAEMIDLHSILFMQRGEVLAEAYNAPFDAETPHRMYSVTKSFTATAFGLAAAEGKLSVEDRIVDLFPEFVPAAADANRDALRVKHLLTMSSGHRQAPFPPNARPIPSLAAFVGQAPEVAEPRRASRPAASETAPEVREDRQASAAEPAGTVTDEEAADAIEQVSSELADLLTAADLAEAGNVDLDAYWEELVDNHGSAPREGLSFEEAIRRGLLPPQFGDEAD